MRRKSIAGKPKKPGAYPVVPWERRPISIERWRDAREILMRDEATQGRRPVEWWLYEKGIEPPDELTDQAEVLLDMGELVGAELAQLMTWWRQDYEQAHNSPTPFEYRIETEMAKPRWPGDSDVSYLTGQAAKDAFFRWRGVPPKIVKQFDAERLAREKVIDGLKPKAVKRRDDR